jgi:hypothetical protein
MLFFSSDHLTLMNSIIKLLLYFVYSVLRQEQEFYSTDGRVPLMAGAEPPCGWRNVTKLGLQCCKGKSSLKRILDSKVGSSYLLGRPHPSFSAYNAVERNGEVVTHLAQVSGTTLCPRAWHQWRFDIATLPRRLDRICALRSNTLLGR